ncbi:putative TIM-barrel fold metal-dependent hydrolase [Shinella sp. BE166]|uniref:Amidohydrolase family protein n=1 Tax=Shinella lacus TaxID=2654216 RepID=A0ABT1R1F7_9HYPH|nr:amidohydrolase family protein [Shinella lacus]MCQ4629003.1 amidohydrolase family protein [Shinella lacus]
MSTTDATIVEPTIAAPVAQTRKPDRKLPAGSCDCHAHIFGPQDKYPYSPKRRYTPHDGPLDRYIALLGTLGIERGVLVQPSTYMRDNTALLDALALNRFPLRGVVVVTPEEVSDADLQRMDAIGVRGIRLNLRHENGAGASAAMDLARRIAPLGWHLQFRMNPEQFVDQQDLLSGLPVPVVVDHIGQVPVEAGLDGPVFQAMLQLLEKGRCWIKLSGPMRVSKQEFPYPDVTPFIHKLVATRPDRLLWATDWPHTTINKAMPNDGDLVDLLSSWIPDDAALKKVLVDNPAEVYRF